MFTMVRPPLRTRAADASLGEYMEQITALYANFTGRISRKTFWLGVLGLILVEIVAAFVILPVLGLGLLPDLSALATSSDSEAAVEMITAGMRRAAWGSLLLFALFAFPSLALTIKRRHDRDSSGLDVVVYFVLTGILMLVQALGIGFTTVDMGGIAYPAPSMALNAAGLVLGVFGIYLFVVLGCLKGTTGANQYGPDPLGTAAALA